MSDVYDQYEELTPFQNCAVSLPRYAKLIGYDECAFWGVVYEGQAQAACNTLWSEFERMTMAQALADAEQDIEATVGYPLCPKWVVGEVVDELDDDARWVDQQRYRGRQRARYSYVLEAGVRAVTVVESGATVDHATDPAVVGPLSTAATDGAEIKVYYPGSDRQIEPSRVVIAGGEVTIYIPRCRMVKGDLLNQPDGGLMYEEVENFLETVDVKLVYNDPSINAELVRPGCKNNACVGGCSECTHSACIYVRDPRNGYLDVRPATYANGVWTAAYPCQSYALVRLNYRCGLKALSPKVERAILRLAHANSPEAPCSCQKTNHLWARDRNVPETVTRERINCPFGMSDGAWAAYTFALGLRNVRAGVL